MTRATQLFVRPVAIAPIHVGHHGRCTCVRLTSFAPPGGRSFLLTPTSAIHSSLAKSTLPTSPLAALAMKFDAFRPARQAISCLHKPDA
jgi:hypothetical protein